MNTNLKKGSYLRVMSMFSYKMDKQMALFCHQLEFIPIRIFQNIPDLKQLIPLPEYTLIFFIKNMVTSILKIDGLFICDRKAILSR